MCVNMEDMLVKKRAETTVYKNLMKHGHSPQDRFHYWPDYHRNIEIGINFGNPGWREKYYESIGSTEEHIPHMCKEYINGLAWNLKYYTSNDPTQECDQSWYYPYSHAPLLKDLVLYLETHPITLPNSKKKYTSLEQLAIVLPPQSKHLLPSSWRQCVSHNIMYPWKFKLDPIGCTFRWECAPLLPLFDESYLDVLNALPLTYVESKRKKQHNEYMF